MLLDYQEHNLKHLEQALQESDTVTVIGKKNSGRKTVISNLYYPDSILIIIQPHTHQYNSYSDFLVAIKNIEQLNMSSITISPEISFGDIISISIEKKELFELENHLINNLKRASRRNRIILVVDNYSELDCGSKGLINKIRNDEIKRKLKKGLISIFIEDIDKERYHRSTIGKELYFSYLSYNKNNIHDIFARLNINPSIDLSYEIKDFILKNSESDIKIIKSIIDDINCNRIDDRLTLLDNNKNIEKMINKKINSVNFSIQLKYILSIISISDKYFSNLDLSFLLSEDLNIVNVYMRFAEQNRYVEQSNNFYSIIFGVIKKIFSTVPENIKIKIYNDIVKLINSYYPNQYKEKYKFARLSNNSKASIYLIQAVFQKIRKDGVFEVNNLPLSKKEIEISQQYFSAFSKSKNNNYSDSIKVIDEVINKYAVPSPIKEEFVLLKSQNLIKFMNERARQAAIDILFYDEADESIDEYLKYRLDTRKIAAYIHNGNYQLAKYQSSKMENKFINILENTHSPGIEYFLNVIYRKYCNIHSYEGSIFAINKSIDFFSKDHKFIKDEYIALNNALALNLINGKQDAAISNIKAIEKIKEENFNYRFPRSEIYENNRLVYKLIYENDDNVSQSFFSLYEKTKEMADNIFICSNYAIALALSNHKEKAFAMLKDKFNDEMILNDREGVYKFRIFCNYAILDFIINNNKESSIEILNKIQISKEDLHYFERSTELNLIIKTIENVNQCDSALKWMELYKQNVETVKNYYCLYQQGFVFTTLFDWDDA